MTLSSHSVHKGLLSGKKFCYHAGKDPSVLFPLRPLCGSLHILIMWDVLWTFKSLAAEKKEKEQDGVCTSWTSEAYCSASLDRSLVSLFSFARNFIFEPSDASHGLRVAGLGNRQLVPHSPG